MRKVLAAAAVAALLAPAAAQASVHVRSVDMGDYPTLRAVVVTSRATTAPPRLSENGQPASGLQTENLGKAKSIVFAIDRSRSMRGKSLAAAIEAVRRFISLRAAADRFAIVTFGSSAVQLTDFSSSTIDSDSALRNVSVDGRSGTALYDAVVTSAQALSSEQLSARVIVLVTDGKDVSSKASLAAAVAEARRVHTAIYAIGIGTHPSSSALGTMARRTGGIYRRATSAASLDLVYGAIANELKRTWRLEWATGAAPGDKVRLNVWAPGAGSASTAVTVPAGAGTGHSGGGSQLPPAAFQSWGTFVVALTVAMIVFLAAGTAVATRRGERLRAQLAPHVSQAARQTQGRRSGRARLEALAGVFQATERALGHTKQWVKIRRLLERADVPLKTVEFLYISIGSCVVLTLLGAALGVGTIVALLLLVVGALAPLGVVWFKARRRLNAFENQLPDLLISIAASLKAGHSFRQGLQAVVDDGVEPASKELKRVLTEARLGRPMEDTLNEMVDRLGSKNFAFVVTAVNIQNQVGGSLAGLFDMIADTVRQRQQFQRKIKALTAMGRMSAYVLVALPFFLAGALWLFNPDYMAPLFDTSTGHLFIIVSLVMMGFGSLILKKIVSFRG